MRAKEYLNQLQKLDIVINQKIKELDDLKSLSQSVKSVDYSNERVKTSPCEEANFVNIINKMFDLENEINYEIDVLANKKHLIINQIQALQNPIHIQILYKRYVEFKSFDVIANEMDYAYQYTRTLHRYALQEFERTYKIIQNNIENIQIK